MRNTCATRLCVTVCLGVALRASALGQTPTSDGKQSGAAAPAGGGARTTAARDAAAAGGRRSDYERRANLRKLTRNKVFRDRVEPHWSADASWLWYRVQTAADRHELVAVDVGKGVRRPAFDHERLAKALAAAGIRNARPDRLPISQLDLGDDGQSVAVWIRGTWWQCDLKTYKVRKSTAEGKPSGAERLRPASTGPKASRRSAARTDVTFFNLTKGTVKLFWLDTGGRRRSYGSIASGAVSHWNTFVGHVWLVVDGKGKSLGVFTAREDSATVEITDKPAQGPAKPPRPPQKPKRPSQGRSSRSSSRSPDGKWTALIKNDNVYLRPTGGGKEARLSADGTPEDRYEGRFYWSPDSKHFVALRVRPAQEHKVYIIESSPRGQVQPKLHSYNYRKPGDRIAVSKPRLFDVAGKRHVPVSDAMFPNPWRIRDIRWSADSSRFTFVYNQRGHQVLRLLAVRAEDGSARALVDETSKTFIHYSGKFFLRWLDETGELLWMSERDGWNHLYLYDAADGTVKNQITKGDWLVRGVDRVDAEKRQIWFRAGGIHPGQDPYHIHYARVNFDGTGLTVLTQGDGTHSITFSPDGRFFVDRYSRVDLPPVTELRRTSDGGLVCVLERADWSELLKAGWQPPIRFAAKGRDGTTDIYGVIYRPTTFDPKAKYPIIESIYAGPQGSYVPKGFRNYHGPQAMAELGFVLVQIDGMGTNHRSKKFHDVCWKNLADAGLPDRILWMKAAAAEHPYMDVTRVGIYGGSAGGQSAAGAVMVHGGFYKVAVADCGCHDNRMDKIWWNEQWMGWPVGPEYAANSNVTLAKGLRGKLLLIAGELDRNVDPASTMQVVDALIKADKDFDLLVIPGAGHGAGGGRYGRRRMADYFVRHLLGVEPRSRP